MLSSGTQSPRRLRPLCAQGGTVWGLRDWGHRVWDFRVSCTFPPGITHCGRKVSGSLRGGVLPYREVWKGSSLSCGVIWNCFPQLRCEDRLRCGNITCVLDQSVEYAVRAAGSHRARIGQGSRVYAIRRYVSVEFGAMKLNSFPQELACPGVWLGCFGCEKSRDTYRSESSL